MSINNGSSRNSYQYNNFQPKVDSNPIAPRVRRKRQRLPPNLLIENASDRDPPPHESLPREAFPIKASGNTEVVPGQKSYSRKYEVQPAVPDQLS